MAKFSNPQIVTNGLVMYYDMTNTKKSWKGQPTTNYIVGPNWLGATLTYDYRGPSNDATYTYVAGVDNPINAPGVMRYYTGPATAYRYWALRGTVPSAGTYTFSYYARVNLGGSSNIGNSQLWRNTGTDIGVTGDFNPTFTTEWKRYSTTGTVTSYLDYFPVHSGAVLGGYTIEYCGFQLEAGSYATPFVDGTRSTAQAIVDLTNKNTLTATSLTYASDNTFSFNGSNDKITLNTNTLISGTSNYTIDVVFKTNAAGVDYIFGNYGSGNSGGLEYYIYQSKLNNYIAGNTQSATTLNLNQWYIASVTRSGSTITHYLNGVADGSATNASSISVTNPFTIGNGHDYTSEAFGGTIAAIKVYNRALSATEVAQNFNALKGRYGL